MYNRIFISHSTKNAWLLNEFLDLIRKVNPDVDLFCSSEAVIPPGGNYKDEIYARLSAADMFIAVISEDYWKSKYSILELGAAYQRYCFDNHDVSIQPVLIPPLDKGMALANTPLVEMQLTDLTSPQAVGLLLKKIAGPENEKTVDTLGIRIAEYAAYIRSSILKMTSLTRDAACGAYYDEPAGNPIPRDRIVRAREMEEGRFLMDFHLSRLDYTPSFASLALEYWDEIDFTEYLKYDKEAALCFTLDNADGALRYVNVELKFGETHKVYQSIRKDLQPGINKIAIPLEPLQHRPLAEINQICFVIIPGDLAAIDGEFVIDDLEVRFETKNILE